jgi:hypothetical protein
MKIRTVAQVALVPVAAVAGFGVTWALKGESSPKIYSAKSLKQCLVNQGYTPSLQSVTETKLRIQEVKFKDKGVQTWIIVTKDAQQAGEVKGIIGTTAFYDTAAAQDLSTYLDEMQMKDNVLVFPKSPGRTLIDKTCL